MSRSWSSRSDAHLLLRGSNLVSRLQTPIFCDACQEKETKGTCQGLDSGGSRVRGQATFVAESTTALLACCKRGLTRSTILSASSDDAGSYRAIVSRIVIWSNYEGRE